MRHLGCTNKSTPLVLMTHLTRGTQSGQWRGLACQFSNGMVLEHQSWLAASWQALLTNATARVELSAARSVLQLYILLANEWVVWSLASLEECQKERDRRGSLEVVSASVSVSKQNGNSGRSQLLKNISGYRRSVLKCPEGQRISVTRKYAINFPSAYCLQGGWLSQSQVA